MSEPIRIANCSGFYGDRLSAAREMVDGGPIDVLTGDWLAELTMLILAKNRRRDPGAGFARTFVAQMEQVMGDCLDRGIRVVANAGGLAPDRCADAVHTVADRLGLAPTIAYIEGDDLLDRLEEIRASGNDLRNLDTGEPFGSRTAWTANAYLGGWGIAEALSRGADIVITGRTTDAALVVGPAAWHHGWQRHDWDALAGAVVAGHVIECGPQATGGNYSFFESIDGLDRLGFPIAEVAADGSSVITKHPGHGGRVTVGTVTAQLLYEIAGPRYANPDVTARFDTIRLTDEGEDRVRVSGVRGEPPPPTAKVALIYEAGHRSTATIMLTGLDVDSKAAVVEAALWPKFAGGRSSFEAVDVQLIRSDRQDPPTNEQAMAQLRITVKDADEHKVTRLFPAAITELALSSIPGFFNAPTASQSFGVYWPTTVAAEDVTQEVVVGGDRTIVAATRPPSSHEPVTVNDVPPCSAPGGETLRIALGRLFGARSGDKGGNANLGIWAETDAAYGWLQEQLTVARLRELLPDVAHLEIDRHPLPNLRAINFVIRGLLGEGVASSPRLDAQAKGLGEYIRAKLVDVPRSLVLDA